MVCFHHVGSACHSLHIRLSLTMYLSVIHYVPICHSLCICPSGMCSRAGDQDTSFCKILSYITTKVTRTYFGSIHSGCIMIHVSTAQRRKYTHTHTHTYTNADTILPLILLPLPLPTVTATTTPDKDDNELRNSTDVFGCSVDAIMQIKVGDTEYFSFTVSFSKSIKVSVTHYVFVCHSLCICVVCAMHASRSMHNVEYLTHPASPHLTTSNHLLHLARHTISLP